MLIAIASQKGGVGKTTTAVTLAHGLALHDQTALLIDLDGQGQASLMLGQHPAPGLRRWYADGEPLSSVLVQPRPGLSLLPGDASTQRVTAQLASEPLGAQAFADRLLDETADYPFVCLDCAPGLNMLQVAAILAADLVLIPARLRFADLAGVQEFLRVLRDVERHAGPKPYAVLPTFFDRVTRETREQMAALVAVVGTDRVLPPIPQDVRIAAAPGFAQTLWEYAPSCAGALGYPTANGRVGGYWALVDWALKEKNHA